MQKLLIFLIVWLSFIVRWIITSRDLLSMIWFIVARWVFLYRINNDASEHREDIRIQYGRTSTISLFLFVSLQSLLINNWIDLIFFGVLLMMTWIIKKHNYSLQRWNIFLEWETGLIFRTWWVVIAWIISDLWTSMPSLVLFLSCFAWLIFVVSWYAFYWFSIKHILNRIPFLIWLLCTICAWVGLILVTWKTYLTSPNTLHHQKIREYIVLPWAHHTLTPFVSGLSGYLQQ